MSITQRVTKFTFNKNSFDAIMFDIFNLIHYILFIENPHLYYIYKVYMYLFSNTLEVHCSICNNDN